MILDEIKNIKRYSIPYLDEVVKFLNRPNLESINESEIEIMGRQLFVRPMRYYPKPAEENKFEAHRIYADIQVMIKGGELMQIAPLNELEPLTEYDPEKDFQFFKANKTPTNLIVPQGYFTFFFPGEAHRPSCMLDLNKSEVIKFVFKVKLNNLFNQYQFL